MARCISLICRGTIFIKPSELSQLMWCEVPKQGKIFKKAKNQEEVQVRKTRICMLQVILLADVHRLLSTHRQKQKIHGDAGDLMRMREINIQAYVKLSGLFIAPTFPSITALLFYSVPRYK